MNYFSKIIFSFCLLLFVAHKLSAQKIDSLSCDSFFVPNVMSPNSEIGNGTFLPLYVCGIPEKFEMKIYNRWGELIFTSTNGNVGWDCSNAKTRGPAEEGVYVYAIRYSYKEGENVKERRGQVRLIK